MLRRILRVAVPAAALALVGCGTITNQSYTNWAAAGEPHTSNRAYGGVRTDYEIVAANYELAADWPTHGQVLFWSWAVLDLPLSAVTDTLLLPYDVWATTTGRAMINPGIQSRPSEAPATKSAGEGDGSPPPADLMPDPD